MQLTCKKCNHVNSNPTGAADEACPACGAIYVRVETALQRQREALQRARLKSIAREEPQRKWMTPVVAKAAYGLVMLVMVIATGISLASPAGFGVMLAATVIVGLVGWIMVEAVLVLFVLSEDAAQIRQHLAVLRARAEAGDDLG